MFLVSSMDYENFFLFDDLSGHGFYRFFFWRRGYEERCDIANTFHLPPSKAFQKISAVCLISGGLSILKNKFFAFPLFRFKNMNLFYVGWMKSDPTKHKGSVFHVGSGNQFSHYFGCKTKAYLCGSLSVLDSIQSNDVIVWHFESTVINHCSTQKLIASNFIFLDSAKEAEIEEILEPVRGLCNRRGKRVVCYLPFEVHNSGYLMGNKIGRHVGFRVPFCYAGFHRTCFAFLAECGEGGFPRFVVFDKSKRHYGTEQVEFDKFGDSRLLLQVAV